MTSPIEKLRNRRQRARRRNSSFSSVSESSRSHHAKDDSGGRRHLKAPIPVRYLTGLPKSLINELVDYGDDDSMVAGNGKFASPVAASRTEDNEVWRKFTALSQSKHDHQHSTFDESTNRFSHPRISPGISARCHQKTPKTIIKYDPMNSVATNTSGSLKHTSNDSCCRHDSHSGQATSLSSEQSTLQHSTNVSRIGQESISYDHARCGPATVLGSLDHLAEQNDSASQSAADARSSLGGTAASPSSEATDCLSPDFNLQHSGSSGSTASATDSVDQRVADLREVALKLISRRAVTPRRDEGRASVDRVAGTLQDPTADCNGYLHRQPPEPPQETMAGPFHDQSPDTDPDDIWFKFVFSDTNTDDLHKQVLAEAAKEPANGLVGQVDGENLGTTTASELGYNMSTVATHGQPSIGATETSHDLTSASTVGTRHNATLGSPVTIQMTGTVFDDWESLDGPSHAAPSMQGSMSLGTTDRGQQDGIDSGSTSVQTMSQGITDITSSFSSRTVEPPQSTAENTIAKDDFIFAPPKLFVGKLSESMPSDRPVTAVKPVTLTKNKRGRPKRKALDGRTNIKSIPMYHGDPIEDFDELGAQARVEPSLFGSLDVE